MAAKTKKRKPAKTRQETPVAPPVQSPPAEPVPAQFPAPDSPVFAAKTEGDTTAFIRREIERYDGDTAIKLYLREIGQVKLLTPQEEIVLAARIKRGDKKAREQMIK